ncbi:DsbA family protein [Kribbella sp. NBC_01505]|uniref:DsbA family oxidoreductase n=1 Tax=Kribbella sp. NBC_01505 TaxID=2903580 RepID=UPI00386E0D0B
MTDQVTIKIFSDYVCPFCMLAEGPIEEATKDLYVNIEWMPFELRAHPHPTLRPEDDYLPAIWARAVYPMARELGVDITLPTVSPQPYTHLAFEGYQYAADHGKGTEYTHRMFQAFFQEDQDLGNPAVLATLAAEIGLDGNAFRAALDNRTYQSRHQEALREAQTHQIQSVPTILVGTTRLEGVPTPAALRQAILNTQADQQLAAASKTTCNVDGC